VAYAALVDALVAAGAPAPLPEDDERGGEGDRPSDDSTTTTTGPDDTTTTAEVAPGETTTTTEAEPDPDPEPGDAAADDDDVSLPDGSQPDIITTLLEADLISVDPGPDRSEDDPILAEPGYRYVFVSQPDLEPAADQMLLQLLPAA